MMDFLDFIKETPTAFHAAKKIKESLEEAGFKELKEREDWHLEKGKKYFVGRNMSSLIAFVIPETEIKGFNLGASHLDSPTFKLKPNFTLTTDCYAKLNTEVYGGPIYSTWFDRPLGLAGRVMVSDDNGVSAKLINIKEAVAMIPNLPIHFNRKVNQGVELNPQVDLIPIISQNKEQDLLTFIAEELKIKKEDIVSSDLYLTILDRGCYAGINKEFIMAPQIDDLECAFALKEAIVSVNPNNNINIGVFFDNEEIGSSTRQGALSTFLDDVLKRISLSLEISVEKYYQLLANSFMISLDNAQGFHPNYVSKYDATNACHMNKGVVIKSAARGSYSTDAFAYAYFKKICQKADVPCQSMTNRSDILGGSTLGALSLRHISIPSVDIGLAQLAMHSAYETAGSQDLAYLIKAMQTFYHYSVTIDEENIQF